MNGSIIAVNITSEDLKLVEISQENGERRVRRLHHYRPGEENSESNYNVTDVIRELIRKDSPKTLKTVIVINSRDIDYRDFSFPFDSPKKVTKTIGFEISSEYPPSEHIVDHIKGVEREQGKNSFWVAITRKEMLRRRIKDVEDAGLHVVGITSDISTLGHYFHNEHEALVMEMGETQTLFALYIHGRPILVRDIPIGIRGTFEGSTHLNKGDLRVLTGEIKRTIHSFNARTGLNLNRVCVTGNILFQQENLRALKEDLGLDFINQIPREIGFSVDEQSDNLNIYASVLGATEWRRKDRSFNFLKDEFIKADPAAIVRGYLGWGKVIILSFLVTVFLSLWLNIMALEKRKAFLESSIRKTFTGAFPHVKRIVDEVKQAKNFLEARKFKSGEDNFSSETSILDALESISRAIPGNINFQIMSLFWERGKLDINGTTDSFKTVNKIQELLSGVENFSGVNISNAKNRSGGQDVEFKITIRIAG
ncbi:MAG: PilN domain-containing protein [Thermodesulfobacteriota bacterium]|nr:PilN domain-containing protein [Thermodesulfobacteriota bacterium]